MKEKILLVLDVSSRSEAMKFVRLLKDQAGMFKVGLQLFLAEGPSLVREIVASGAKVFLDLKLHDIPNTVRHAALEAAGMGVSMMTVHAAGGREMMSGVTGDLRERFGDRRPLVVAVTVLTSLNNSLLTETGVAGGVENQVIRLACLAEDCGVDGVVCSPQEIRAVRSVVRSEFKLVTPGVRLAGQSADDQQRIALPGEAIANGADYIVVGRAVMADPDPRAALERLIQSL